MIKKSYKFLFLFLLSVFIVGGISFFQLFESTQNNLPKVYFYRWRSIPFYKKSTTLMSYISNNHKIDHIYFQKIKAKARGGSTEDFPKHNFTIELATKHQFAGLESDDDWILGASFLEKSFIRHKLSFDLFRLFNVRNKAPKCGYLEVYRNFKYHGLYVAMERMDSKRLEINKNDSSACLFKEPPVFFDPQNKANSNPYKENDVCHQKYPDLNERNKSSEIIKITKLISYAPDSVFEREIGNYFNLDNIIDWHILMLITHNGDGIIKGFYLYKKDKKSQFMLAPWDYDHSFGRDGDNEVHLPGIVNWERNTLLERLVRTNTLDYKTRLKERYSNLVDSDVLTTENIVSMIDVDYLRIKDFAIKNEERWPVDAEPFFDNANFEDEILTIKKWIPVQLQIVGEYLRGL